MYDSHVHTCFSADSETPPQDYLLQAQSMCLDGLCFTDHLDIEFPYGMAFDIDFNARNACFDALSPVPGVMFTRGLELGLRREAHIIEENRRIVTEQNLDFILGSVHVVASRDPYYASYFDGYTRRDGFVHYLKEILACITLFDGFHVLSHMDYPAKNCPFEENCLHPSDAPDILDAIFRLLISRGQSMEINTSVFRAIRNPRPAVDILSRFAALGGEWVTIGSDAHTPQQLGGAFDDARALAKAAGIRYLAHFCEGKPILTPIDKE